MINLVQTERNTTRDLGQRIVQMAKNQRDLYMLVIALSSIFGIALIH